MGKHSLSFALMAASGKKIGQRQAAIWLAGPINESC